MAQLRILVLLQLRFKFESQRSSIYRRNRLTSEDSLEAQISRITRIIIRMRFQEFNNNSEESISLQQRQHLDFPRVHKRIIPLHCSNRRFFRLKITTLLYEYRKYYLKRKTKINLNLLIDPYCIKKKLMNSNKHIYLFLYIKNH